jgi:D-glycero-D-manno-heptose 1,7-bisphosphate phosphatase
LNETAARLVMIDRDGVINRDSDEYIKNVAEWQPLPGSLEALRDLTRAGFRIAVITNQSGIGRGLFSERTLGEIHDAMRAAVEAAGGRIDGIFYCPHLPDAGCRCRKPAPGLLLDVSRSFGIPIEGVAFIGDKQSDVDAAISAGARPVLVGDRVAEGSLPDVERYPDLAAAARALITEADRG